MNAGHGDTVEPADQGPRGRRTGACNRPGRRGDDERRNAGRRGLCKGLALHLALCLDFSKKYVSTASLTDQSDDLFD